jgi:REP element-mobilizing transposase RayT
MSGNPEFYRRRLPHWQPPGATLFVTFRLAGSLPAAVIAQLRAERERQERLLAQIADVQNRHRRAYLEERRAFGRWDGALDAAVDSPRWLARPEIADIVFDALQYRAGKIYDLTTFCIMPNHVHLVCTPLPRGDGTYHVLHRILQSLKRYTATRANRILRRRGAFWQGENYDHVVRDEKELERIVRYVIGNPIKAGLVTEWNRWPWTYCKWNQGRGS